MDPWGLALQGVDFSGSPDLFPVKSGQNNIVEITMQGSRGREFTAIYKAAGITKVQASGYIWHHVDNFDPTTGKTTMQLVKTSAHEATYPHKGSVSQFEKHTGLKYDTSDAVKYSDKKGWLTGRKPPKPQTKKPPKSGGCGKVTA